MESAVRLMIKLSVFVLLFFVIQAVIDASGGPLDRAQFIVRVGIADMCGKGPEDEALVEAARKLHIRENVREFGDDYREM